MLTDVKSTCIKIMTNVNVILILTTDMADVIAMWYMALMPL